MRRTQPKYITVFFDTNDAVSGSKNSSSDSGSGAGSEFTVGCWVLVDGLGLGVLANWVGVGGGGVGGGGGAEGAICCDVLILLLLRAGISKVACSLSSVVFCTSQNLLS
jgi:hypothetical protein